MNMETIGVKLLDFSQPFDVSLLDHVVMAMNNPSHAERSMANSIMVALQEHKDSWSKVCDILEQSSNPSTRFFGLQILEDAVKYRWKILPIDQRNGIKQYIVTKLLDLSKDEQTLQRERMFIHKMDLVLVQVLKQEWPHNWPNFIADIVSSSKSSEVLCENNMLILKLLSEEIFDFSKDQMTAEKIKNLKISLNQEFLQIYQLCEFVLEKSTRISLITITLQTLERFVSWIPWGYVFETQLMNLLITKFFPVPAFRNDTLACLTEINGFKDVEDKYRPVYVDMYTTFITSLASIIQPGMNLNEAFQHDEVFIQRLALFFTSFFRFHVFDLEGRIQNAGDNGHQSLLAGFTYLVNISEVDDDGVFKICLDYWHYFLKELYGRDTTDTKQNVLMLTNSANGNKRKSLYANVLSRVRLVMISKMVKPSEVLIVEDENGEIVRETTQDTEALSQYKTMHEALVYLTHLDYEDTENIMLEKLAFQVDGSEWSWNNLNTLCWAIGSISGSMNEEDEKRFLVTVIKDLLGLCEMKRGKDNKAVIASNIMYVVGQYPRFLRAHWKFLKTVVNKLFEFMHELHPGVQDMACDTFLKIAQKCKRKFVTMQTGERQTFVEDLLVQLPAIVSDLQTHQIHTFYEAVACMLSAESHAPKQQELLRQLMDLPNHSWKNLMNTAQNQVGPSFIFDAGVIKEITKILRTNVSVCKAIGAGFQSQMGDLFNDLMGLHDAYGKEIGNRVRTQGEIVIRSSDVRNMRAVKKEILNLIRSFIEVSNNAEMIVNDFLPLMLEPILLDYQGGVPAARDSEVLTLMAICIEKLKESMSGYVNRILTAVFECTLQMITKNFEDFPEHRMNFFQLLKAVNTHCFQALFSIPPDHQKLVVDSIVWAFKHTERNIADTGLETLYALLQNVQQNQTIAQAFYGQFYLSLLQDVLGVLTDRLHKSGFKLHATLLKHMFSIAESGQITAPLWESAGVSVPAGHTNQQFLHEYVVNLISTSFPNLSKSQCTAFVVGCFDMSKDLPWFKNHLRDFLVNIKEFAGEDNSDLYLEENTMKSELQEQQMMAARLAVPGLVQPNDRPDDLADL